LSDKTTAKKVKSTLATLRKGADALDHAYGEALERIEHQQAGHASLAKHVLTWITFAKRPLTTAEICCALAIEPGDAELDPENKPDVDEIVSVCAGLVVVDQDSAIIRLVHYTTQEYFECIGSRLSPDGQLSLATACLTYLTFSVFETGRCATDKEFEVRLREHQLLNYAAEYGGEHTRYVEDKVDDLACTLLAHSGLYSCAAQVLFAPSDKFIGYSQSDPTITGLHWAARFGLCKIATSFLCTAEEDEKRIVNAKDSAGRSSLMYAIERWHWEMAALLLEKGADVNAQNGQYGKALYLALLKENEQIVKLLLDKGPNVDVKSGYYGNIL